MSTTSARPTVNGLLVLRLPLAPGSPFVRHVLCKAHKKSGENDNWPEGRTLFLTSLDLSLNEKSLKKALEVFGEVDECHLKQLKSNKKASARTPVGVCSTEAKDVKVLAHIVFKHHGSLDKVLNDVRLEGEVDLPLPSGGRKKWAALDAKQVRDHGELQRETDAWMVDFEEREAEAERIANETVGFGFWFFLYLCCVNFWILW